MNLCSKLKFETQTPMGGLILQMKIWVPFAKKISRVLADSEMQQHNWYPISWTGITFNLELNPYNVESKPA